MIALMVEMMIDAKIDEGNMTEMLDEEFNHIEEPDLT